MLEAAVNEALALVEAHTANYYGGTQAAHGDWHGHTNVNEQGDLTYHREPGVKK